MSPLEITLVVILVGIGIAPWVYSIGKYAIKQLSRYLF